MLFTILPVIILVISGTNVTGREHLTIGLSISEFHTERWAIEQEMMAKLAKEKGVRIVTQVANHDPQLQNEQIRNLVRIGADVIIIIAGDGEAAASAVEYAASKDVPAIAYDRLIESDQLAAYISFDNVEVGRAQAKGILAKTTQGNFVLLGGSPTDNNAILLRKGQMEILAPHLQSGQITIIEDRWVKNWSPAIAAAIMEEILDKHQGNIDGIIASNDGTALGALGPIRARGLAGKIPISGQDATLAGCRSIIAGELSVTVFKDVRKLSPLAIEMAISLARGQRPDKLVDHKLSELALDEELQGSVPCLFLDVVSINRDNLHAEIIESNFQSSDNVYLQAPGTTKPK